MSTQFRVLSVVVVALGAMTAACGDSDPDPLTKSEFITQADAICAASNAELNTAMDTMWEGSEDFDAEDPAMVNLFWDRFAEAMDTADEILDSELSELRALEPPSADREMLETLYNDLEETVDAYVADAHAAADGDATARDKIDNGVDDPFDDINRRARAYGLNQCGDPGE